LEQGKPIRFAAFPWQEQNHWTANYFIGGPLAQGTRMLPQDFIAKWQRANLSERSAAQQHFLDLCDLLGQPKPDTADANGTFCAFLCCPVFRPAGWPNQGTHGHLIDIRSIPIRLTIEPQENANNCLRRKSTYGLGSYFNHLRLVQGNQIHIHQSFKVQ
jgi:hypothetical protein